MRYYREEGTHDPNLRELFIEEPRWRIDIMLSLVLTQTRMFAKVQYRMFAKVQYSRTLLIMGYLKQSFVIIQPNRCLLLATRTYKEY